jgi:hypothetical protein
MLAVLLRTFDLFVPKDYYIIWLSFSMNVSDEGYSTNDEGYSTNDEGYSTNDEGYSTNAPCQLN